MPAVAWQWIRITAAVSWSRLKVIRRSSLRQFKHLHRNFLFDAIIISPSIDFRLWRRNIRLDSQLRWESYVRIVSIAREALIFSHYWLCRFVSRTFVRNPVCNDKNTRWIIIHLTRYVVILSHDNVNYSMETMSAIIVATDWAMGGSRLISLHGKCTLSRVCTTQASPWFILSANSTYFSDTQLRSWGRAQYCDCARLTSQPLSSFYRPPTNDSANAL